MFQWTTKANNSFELLRVKLSTARVLALSDFLKIFEVDCDAFNVGIGRVLSQEGYPFVFFSEMLNNTRKNYSTYDIEFYAIVQAQQY